MVARECSFVQSKKTKTFNPLLGSGRELYAGTYRECRFFQKLHSSQLTTKSIHLDRVLPSPVE